MSWPTLQIGDDIFGHEMIENFRQHNINIGIQFITYFHATVSKRINEWNLILENVLLTKDAFTSTAAICVTDSGKDLSYCPFNSQAINLSIKYRDFVINIFYSYFNSISRRTETLFWKFYFKDSVNIFQLS